MEDNKTGSAALKKRLFRLLPFLALLPAGFALPRIAARFPWDVERLYSSGVYPRISGAVGSFTGLVGFSAAEVLIAALLLSVAAMLVFNLIRLFRKRLHPLRFASFIVALMVLAGALLLGFYAMWGLNYFRPTLYQLMDLPVKERDAAELYSVTKQLAETANGLSPNVPRNENGVFEVDHREYFAKVPAAYDELAKKHPIFSGTTPRAKGVMISEGMSWAGISGIFIPYTAEANVNIHQPSLLMLSSAAHESAHFKGFAREDEANFIAYLACSASDDPALAYSGTMLALINCGNRLYDSSPELYRSIYATYSDELIRDIRDYNAYWNSYEGEVEEAFDNMNDNYLKFNHQQDGVRSYGMMVDLMLAYAEKYGL